MRWDELLQGTGSNPNLSFGAAPPVVQTPTPKASNIQPKTSVSPAAIKASPAPAASTQTYGFMDNSKYDASGKPLNQEAATGLQKWEAQINPSTAPEPKPEAKTPTASLNTVLQGLLGSVNKPFDYNTEMQNAKNAYEQTYGDLGTRTKAMTESTQKLYDKARQDAEQEIKGNLSVRDLLSSVEADKEISQNAQDFATKLSADLSTITNKAQDDEAKSVWDMLQQAATAKQNQQNSLISMLTSLVKPMESNGQIFGYDPLSGTLDILGGSAKTDYPTSYQEYQLALQSGFSGTYNDYLNMDANRKRSVNTSVTYNQQQDQQTSNLLKTYGAELQKTRGADGFVDPDTYLAYYTQFAASTRNPQLFENTFLSLVNPKDRARVAGKISDSGAGLDLSVLSNVPYNPEP